MDDTPESRDETKGDGGAGGEGDINDPLTRDVEAPRAEFEGRKPE